MHQLLEDITLRLKLLFEEIDLRVKYAYDRDPLLFRSVVGTIGVVGIVSLVGVGYSYGSDYIHSSDSVDGMPAFEVKSEGYNDESADPGLKGGALEFDSDKDVNTGSGFDGYTDSSSGSSGGQSWDGASDTIPESSDGCDPNYSPCVPVVSYDLNCPDIGFTVQVLGYDRHGFDRDGDGWGCETY